MLHKEFIHIASSINVHLKMSRRNKTDFQTHSSPIQNLFLLRAMYYIFDRSVVTFIPVR